MSFPLAYTPGDFQGLEKTNSCSTFKKSETENFHVAMVDIKYFYYTWQNYETVSSEVWKINSSEDVITTAQTRGEPRGPSQQILYDCYVSS